MSENTQEYDFVIVGGGTSGLTVAARLTEDPNVTVLVVEAGDNHLDDLRVNMPGGWAGLLESEADWNFKTVPQDALNGRPVGMPQGKALGGSSAINIQMFAMPSESGIDAWEEAGNPGWGWKELSPYFRKFHTLISPSPSVASQLGITGHHSDIANEVRGPIQVSFLNDPKSPLPSAWSETMEKLGYGFKGQVDNGTSWGVSAIPATIDPVSGQRSYSARAYYAPNIDRPNLHVLTKALVTKINTEVKDEKVVASGITIAANDATTFVKAKKEVILAAGALNSPTILELSGIGSGDLLKTLGIPVVIDNANVGENVQDHVLTGNTYEVVDGIETMDGIARGEPGPLQAAIGEYIGTQSGPLSRPPVTANALLPLPPTISTNPTIDELLGKYPSEKDEKPFQEFARKVLQNPSTEASCMTLATAIQAHLGSSNAKEVFSATYPENYISIAVSLMNPLSAGSVHISSADPAAVPILDMKYLSHPLDVEVLARHVQFISTIAATEPFASLLKVGGKTNPLYKNSVDIEEAKEYVRQTMTTNFHPSGSCAMLPLEKGGVVDPELIVHGTANIRIIDASIMPVIPRANLLTTVYAVAEKAADLIKDHWSTEAA